MLCPAGHYCIEGAEVPLPCPPGTYCSGNNSLPWPCKPGTYNMEAMQSSCRACPAGFICSPGGVVDYANGTFYATLGLGGCSEAQILAIYNSSAEALRGYVQMGGTVRACERLSSGANFVCPAGNFCPEGLVNLADGRCPRGTFSNRTGLANVSQCMSCTAGMYCNDTGMTSPRGPCDRGYYCTRGAADARALTCERRMEACDTPGCANLWARPANESCGGICPIGSFCTEASSAPTPCPPGQYCGVQGLFQVSGPCEAGYYCASAEGGASGGESRPTGSYPVRGPCPAGFFCPPGTIYLKNALEELFLLFF